MKNLFLTARGAISIENNEPVVVNGDREAISSVYLIEEPTHIVYARNDKRIELDANEGDIVIHFYDYESFKNPVVIVNSLDWAENIRLYKEYEQKRKEEWAKKQAEKDGSKGVELEAYTEPNYTNDEED